jgi:hypothetical protein
MLAREGWQPAQWATAAVAGWWSRTREGEESSVGVALGATVGALLGAEDGSPRGIVGDVPCVDGTNALALVEARTRAWDVEGRRGRAGSWQRDARGRGSLAQDCLELELLHRRGTWTWRRVRLAGVVR